MATETKEKKIDENEVLQKLLKERATLREKVQVLFDEGLAVERGILAAGHVEIPPEEEWPNIAKKMFEGLSQVTLPVEVAKRYFAAFTLCLPQNPKEKASILRDLMLAKLVSDVKEKIADMGLETSVEVVRVLDGSLKKKAERVEKEEVPSWQPK